MQGAGGRELGAESKEQGRLEKKGDGRRETGDGRPEKVAFYVGTLPFRRSGIF